MFKTNGKNQMRIRNKSQFDTNKDVGYICVYQQHPIQEAVLPFILNLKLLMNSPVMGHPLSQIWTTFTHRKTTCPKMEKFNSCTLRTCCL